MSESAQVLPIPLRLSEALAGAGSIQFETSDETASSGKDYLGTNGVLQIEAGPYSMSTNSAVLKVQLLHDSEREGNENFWLELKEPIGPLELGARKLLQIRILDNDQGVRFDRENELQVSDVPRSITVEVLRGDDGSEPVTVEYSTVDGTALDGADYLAASGTLRFEAGEASKQIEISVLANTLLESDELFSVVLKNVSGGTLGTPSARTVRILNGQPSLLTPVLLARERPQETSFIVRPLNRQGAQSSIVRRAEAEPLDSQSKILKFRVSHSHRHAETGRLQRLVVQQRIQIFE